MKHGDPIYEDVGPTPRFMQLARKYRRSFAQTPARPKARKAAAPRRRAR
jgi:hypothetical protein